MDELIKIIQKLKTAGELETFFRGILTASEIKELHKRIQIVKMLHQGVAQHKIAEELGVGVATVTRGANEIKLRRFNNSFWRDSTTWRA